MEVQASRKQNSIPPQRGEQPRSAFLSTLPPGHKQTCLRWFRQAAELSDNRPNLVLFHLRGIARRVLNDRTVDVRYTIAARELLQQIEQNTAAALALASDVISEQIGEGGQA